MKSMLLMDLVEMGCIARNEIMDDFEFCVGVILYAAELELACYMTVPFICCAVRNNKDLAR